MRVRRRLLPRRGWRRCSPCSGWPFFHYYSFNFYWYFTRGGFRVCRFRSYGFVGRGKRGNAAGGAPRLVCAGSVIAQPSPSQDCHRSRREPCPGHPCPPGGSRTWNARGGLCSYGSGFPFTALSNDYSCCLRPLYSLPLRRIHSALVRRERRNAIPYGLKRAHDQLNEGMLSGRQEKETGTWPGFCPFISVCLALADNFVDNISSGYLLF